MPKKVRKKVLLLIKRAQKSTLKSTFGSSAPICEKVQLHQTLKLEKEWQYVGMADLVYVDGKPVAEEGDEEDYCSHKDDGGNDEVECKSFRHFLLLFKCFRSVPKVEVGFWGISIIFR